MLHSRWSASCPAPGLAIVSPRNTLRRFGTSWCSFWPTPYAVFSILIARSGLKSVPSVASIAAPVGVVASKSTPSFLTGIPLIISAVAGAGTGSFP